MRPLSPARVPSAATPLLPSGGRLPQIHQHRIIHFRDIRNWTIRAAATPPGATHHTLHALGAALAGENLTAAEINALANLADGGVPNVRELSERTGTRASTLTGVLDRLEHRGYLARELDAADRRSFRLPLTEAGRAVAARVRRAVADLEREAARGLSATQIAGFHAVISALQEACDATS